MASTDISLDCLISETTLRYKASGVISVETDVLAVVKRPRLEAAWPQDDVGAVSQKSTAKFGSARYARRPAARAGRGAASSDCERFPRLAVLGRDATLRPNARPNALVEHVGSEVGAAGPRHCPRLDIQPSLREACVGAGATEHRPSHARENIDFAGETIGEGEAKNAARHGRDLGDVRRQSDHRSGSMSSSVSPARALRQLAISSS